MNHKQKTILAKRLKREEKGWSGAAGIFQTDAWLTRAEQIQARVKRKQGLAHARAIARNA